MTIASGILALADQILERHNEARAGGRVLSLDINALVASLRSIARDVNTLEVRTDRPHTAREGMTLSTQLFCFGRRLADLSDAADRDKRPMTIDLNELIGALKRLGTEACGLEMQVEAANAGLSSEYVTSTITNARWLLQVTTTPPMVRELAEAVLVLAGRANPS